MNKRTQHKIDLECEYINTLWDRYDSGDDKAKFILALYIREFKLHPQSTAYAKTVLSYMENNDYEKALHDMMERANRGEIKVYSVI